MKISKLLLNDNNFKDVIKGSSVAFSLRMLGVFIGYAFVFLITRNYGVEVWGAFILSLTLLQILTMLSKLGLDSALLRFIAEYSAQNKPYEIKGVYLMALKIITVSSSIVTICIIPLAPLVANSVFNKPDISNYFQMISFGILPLALIYLHSESLRALKKIKEFVFMRNVAAFLIAVVILLFLFFFNKTDYDPFIAYVSGIALTSYLSYRVWSKISGYKLTSIRSTVKLKSILEVSIPMLTVSSLVFLMSWIDTIMIGIFKTERDVGIYNVAVKITDFMSIFLISIGSIVAPKFAEAYGINDMGMSRKLLRLSSRMLFYLAIPIFTLIFTASYYILMFFGKDFIQGNLALRILLVGQVVNILSGLNGIFLNMNGEHRFVRNVIIIAAVLNIVLNYLLIPRFGLIGAASATTVIRIFWNMLFIIYIYYKYNALSFYLPFLPGNRKMDVL